MLTRISKGCRTAVIFPIESMIYFCHPIYIFVFTPRGFHQLLESAELFNALILLLFGRFLGLLIRFF
jgi:hypothetical protein